MMCARLFTKGAAEQIVQLCTKRIRDDSGVALLGHEEKQHLLASFSEDGNRYICSWQWPVNKPNKFLNAGSIILAWSVASSIV